MSDNGGGNGNSGGGSGTSPLRHVGTGGVVGSHDPYVLDDAVLAPTTVSELNTIRIPIVAVACYKIEDIRFIFDCSFILPDIANELPHLPAQRQQFKDPSTGTLPPLIVFGHADPVGSDDYNKTLSGRRATAVYGLLTHNPQLWENLYGVVLGNDNWTKRAPAVVLDTVNGSHTDDDVSNFQSSSSTRMGLWKQYIEKISAGVQFQTTDFLCKGQDSKGKGDYQGCSEFNPVVLLSDQQMQSFPDDDARNLANAPNRRVLVLLLRPGSQIAPAKWPCPTVDQDTTGCRARFWKDGNQRRAPDPVVQRNYEDTHDTFACRFYDRLAGKSPCEPTRLVTTLTLRIMDGDNNPFKDALYQLVINRPQSTDGSQQTDTITDKTGDDGIIEKRIPADATGGTLSLYPTGSGSNPPAGATSANPVGTGDPLWKLNLTIQDLQASDTVAGVQERLNNLGWYACDTVDQSNTTPVGDLPVLSALPDDQYDSSQLEQARMARAVQRFQMVTQPNGPNDIPQGNVDAPTKAKLEEAYGS
jgi:hypothetical protein